MYGLPPPVSIYDIAMGKLTKQLNALPFRWDKRTSTDGSTTHSEKQMEKQKYNGPYDDSKIPILTIHSFIMGVFVSMGGLTFLRDLSVSMLGDDARFAARECTDTPRGTLGKSYPKLSLLLSTYRSFSWKGPF